MAGMGFLDHRWYKQRAGWGRDPAGRGSTPVLPFHKGLETRGRDYPCAPCFRPDSAEPIRCVMKTRSAPVFVRVAQDLYRYQTGTYYAIVKNAGRRIHRSLDTTDRKLADRRLAEFKTRTSELVSGPDANSGFGINKDGGRTPGAGLLLGSDGLFYGTTEYGGEYGAGCVFSFNVTPARPQLLSLSVSSNSNVVQFSGTPTNLYEVQRSTDLLSWPVLGTLTAPTEGNFSYTNLSLPRFIGSGSANGLIRCRAGNTARAKMFMTSRLISLVGV